MTDLLVSIILPTYNANPEWIKMALDSILNQTFVGFELIIIDDASKNNIKPILDIYLQNDPRVKYIRNDINIERSASKNRGISMARGKYIAFIDDDDIWCSIEKLQKQVDFMETYEEYVLCGTDLNYINEEGYLLYVVTTKKSDLSLREALLGSNQFAHSSILIRRNVLKEAGLFNENLSLAEDYDLWLRIGRYGKICNLDFIGIAYRDRKTNTSNKHKFKLKLSALIVSLKSIRYYPFRIRGIIIHFITLILPNVIIRGLIKVNNRIKN